MSASARPETQRLFFALWPDEPVRADLARAAEAIVGGMPGRRTPAEKLHLTLLFLGNLDAGARQRAEAAAASVAVSPFTLAIGRAGWFAAARVAWLAPREAPPQLAALRESLRTRLAGAGVPFDENAFHPHVTCLRRAESPPRGAAVAAVAWPVRDFVLVHSHRTRYELVGRWPPAAR